VCSARRRWIAPCKRAVSTAGVGAPHSRERRVRTGLGGRHIFFPQ
jgi:hypothetical protein